LQASKRSQDYDEFFQMAVGMIDTTRDELAPPE